MILKVSFLKRLTIRATSASPIPLLPLSLNIFLLLFHPPAPFPRKTKPQTASHMSGVLYTLLCLDVFSLRNIRKVSNTCNFFLINNKNKHRITIISIPENNMIYIAIYSFQFFSPYNKTSGINVEGYLCLFDIIITFHLLI